MTVVQIQELDITIQQKTILKSIQFEVEKGDFIGLIGPNGSGKSTLLKSIASIQRISKGSVLVDGKELKKYKQKELAKLISYVPQDTSIDFDFKAKEIVLMGRHVHSSRFQSESKNDFLQIRTAMEQTNTWQLAERSVLSLSGGQRQLVLIAKALAQETPIILLDEPISALDIYYQLRILSMLKDLSDKGKTIIVVLHDLNLASRFCNKLLMLEEGEIVKYGNSTQVLTQKLLKRTYQVDSKIRNDEVTDSVTVTALQSQIISI